MIGGRALTEYFASLYIVKTSLKSLGLRSLKKIHSGSIAILENKDLCFAQGVDWKRIKKSMEHNTLLQNNKPEEACSKYIHLADQYNMKYLLYKVTKIFVIQIFSFNLRSLSSNLLSVNLR